MGIVSWVVFGLVAGVVAKLLMPGRDPGGCIITMLLAKVVNFGLLYGQGAEGLRNYARGSYGVEMGLEDARRYRKRFFATYPGIKAWHEREWHELKGETPRPAPSRAGAARGS